MNNFPCQAFNDELPRGRASGEFTISDAQLHFKIREHTFNVPLDSLSIKLGGASNRLLFFEHPQLNGWQIYTSDQNLLHNPILLAHPELLPQIKAAKNKKRSKIIVFVLVFALLLASPFVLFNQLGWFSAQIARNTPAEWEQQLGQSASAQLKLSKHYLPDEIYEDALAPLTQALTTTLASERYTFRFSIVEDSSPNAFALPGGFVVIHSGLILKADRAEELLGVLAHEIIHVSQQHGLRSVINSAGLYLVIAAMLGDSSGLLATIGGAAPLLINQSYSRDFEREADRKGHELLVAANINPSGLASFFEKLIEEEQKRLEAIDNEEAREILKSASNFLSTHPATEERVQNLKALTESHQQQYQNFDSEFRILQSALSEYLEQAPLKEANIEE